MLHRIEQPTLFELNACDDFDLLGGLPLEHAAPKVAPKSDPSALEGRVFFREPQAFKAVSPLASMSLHEVCAACGREISSGSGFVILDYEELGVFCDQGCRDKRFRSYLYDLRGRDYSKFRGRLLIEFTQNGTPWGLAQAQRARRRYRPRSRPNSTASGVGNRPVCTLRHRSKRRLTLLYVVWNIGRPGHRRFSFTPHERKTDL